MNFVDLREMGCDSYCFSIYNSDCTGCSKNYVYIFQMKIELLPVMYVCVGVLLYAKALGERGRRNAWRIDLDIFTFPFKLLI